MSIKELSLTYPQHMARVHVSIFHTGPLGKNKLNNVHVFVLMGRMAYWMLEYKYLSIYHDM